MTALQRIFLTFTFLLVGIGYAQVPAPLTNADILKLIQANVPESIIINKIKANVATLDTSADALIALTKAGATEAELAAMTAITSTLPQVQRSPPISTLSPDKPLSVLGGAVYLRNEDVFFQVATENHPSPQALRFQVVLVDGQPALMLAVEAISPKGTYTLGDLIFDKEKVTYFPRIDAGLYHWNPFPNWAPTKTPNPVVFANRDVLPVFKTDNENIISADFGYVENQGFIYREVWHTTRLNRKVGWGFNLGETYATPGIITPSGAFLASMLQDFERTLSTILSASEVKDAVHKLPISSTYREPTSEELADAISKHNADMDKRHRMYSVVGSAKPAPSSSANSGSLLNALQGAANMQAALKQGNAAAAAHDNIGALNSAVNYTKAEMDTIGSVDSNSPKVQALPGAVNVSGQPSSVPFSPSAQPAMEISTPAATPGGSAFNVNETRANTTAPAKTDAPPMPPHALPQPGRIYSNSGTAAPPIAASAPQSPYVASTTAICPASGFVPGVMKQSGDTAVGVTCIPGQPIGSATSSGGTAPSTGSTTDPSNLQICREVTLIVRNTPTSIPDGPFSCPAHMSNQLTNNSINTVTCTWAYFVNGQYTGQGTSSIAPGQTIGGTMSGMDSCNTSGMKYYCFDGKDPNDSHGVSCLKNIW